MFDCSQDVMKFPGDLESILELVGWLLCSADKGKNLQDYVFRTLPQAAGHGDSKTWMLGAGHLLVLCHVPWCGMLEKWFF